MTAGAPAKSNLALRLLTAALWVPFILWMLFLGPRLVFPGVAGLVCALGGAELFAMVAPGRRAYAAFGALASVGLFYLVAFEPSASAWPLATIGLTCAGLLFSLLLPHPIEHAATRMGWTVAGPLYTGGLFGTIAWLYLERGGAWVLLALLCSFLADTTAYFVGRSLGRHPLSPVSPKKTVEGALGGIAGGLLSGTLAHFWFLPELSLPHALGLSLAATVAGQAGDLCESLIKRATNIKDSGTPLSTALLRGHGGILDRSDAMVFSAATIWAYAKLFT